MEDDYPLSRYLLRGVEEFYIYLRLRLRGGGAQKKVIKHSLKDSTPKASQADERTFAHGGYGASYTSGSASWLQSF